MTGKIEEKHAQSPPEGKFSKKTGLYTLIVQPNNDFEMLVNNESVKKGNLLKDFEPSVNPPKEIEDKDDKKPADWVDEAKYGLFLFFTCSDLLGSLILKPPSLKTGMKKHPLKSPTRKPSSPKTGWITNPS